MRLAVVSIGLACLMTTAAIAQTETAFPRYLQFPGASDDDGFPTSGVKLCLFADRTNCFVMPHLESDSKITYEFGLDPHSEREELQNGASWIFFTGTFSGGGSGTLTRFAILRYDTKTRAIQNLLPQATATNISDFAVWHLPDISSYPVLVIADFFWNFDAGETHFDAHQYDVEAFVYNPRDHVYEKRFRYRTSHKYDAETSRVLQPERNEILKKLSEK